MCSGKVLVLFCRTVTEEKNSMETDDQVAMKIAMELGAEFLATIVLIVPIWRIFRRAGFAGLWALLMFIPFVGYLGATLMLALRRWPSTAEVAEAE